MEHQPGFNYFKAGTYLAAGRYSHPLWFANIFREEFESVPFYKKDVLNKLKAILEARHQSLPQSDAERAKAILVSEDLALIYDALNEAPEFQDVTLELERKKTEFIDLLSSLGLEFQKPNLYVVDSYPSPYDKLTGGAISPDLDDEQKYGIQAGIYFKKTSIIPIYAEFLLAHELIHKAVDVRGAGMLGRGLEDGIAELLGSLYCGLKGYGEAIGTRVFLNHRLKYGAEQKWDMYLDYFRQAAGLYERFGLDGLVGLIRKGRAEIKAVELQCLTNTLPAERVPETRRDPTLDKSVGFLALEFCRNYVVSPLSVYVARHVEPGMTTMSVAKEAGISVENAEAALNELQRRVGLLIIDECVVISSDAKAVADSGGLRYEIT